jgi:hypothetical protein
MWNIVLGKNHGYKLGVVPGSPRLCQSCYISFAPLRRITLQLAAPHGNFVVVKSADLLGDDPAKTPIAVCEWMNGFDAFVESRC